VYNIILSVSIDIYGKGVNADWKGLYIKAVYWYITSYQIDNKKSVITMDKRVKITAGEL